MDRDLRNLLIVAAIAAGVLFVARPKGFSIKKGKKDLTAPKPSKTSTGEFESAKIALQAMRAAVNDGASNDMLDELNSEIIKDYGVKVYVKDGLFFAKNRKGDIIAKEQ